jgi:hypothetical protein
MAITLNGSVQIADNSGGTGTTTHTGTNSGESVVIGAMWRGDTGVTITGVDVGGQAATSTPSINDTTNQHRMQFWYLPSLSSGGSKTVTVTYSGSILGVVFSAVLAGTDTAALVRDQQSTTGSSTSAGVALPSSVAGDAIFELVTGPPTAPTLDSGYSRISLTDFWSYAEGQYILSAASGGSTPTMTVQDGAWSANAIALKAASAAGSPVLGRRIFILP